MAVNPKMLHVLKKCGKTPGFRLRTLDDHNFKVVRLPHGEFREATVKISPYAKETQYKNDMVRLKRIGWTEELFAQLEEITERHRKEQTDHTDEIRSKLLEAFRELDDTPVTGEYLTDEEAEDKGPVPNNVRRVRKGSTTGSARKPKAGVAEPAEASLLAPIKPAPIELIEDLPVIRAQWIGYERAFDLLGAIAPYQRSEIPKKVADWEVAMEKGEWEPMESDAICIDVNGHLANGRHRIQALFNVAHRYAQQGKEFKLPFYVAENVPVSRFKNMDKGAKRTTAHTLQSMGKSKNATLLASTLRLAYLWFNVPDQAMWATHPTVTDPQIISVMENHPGIEESLSHGGRISSVRKVRVSPTASVLCHYLIATKMGTPATVTRWYQAIANRDLNRRSPGEVLADYMTPTVATRYRVRNKRPQPEVHMYLLMQAWNNTCKGREVSKAQPPSDEFTIPQPLSPGKDALNFWIE